MYRRLTMIEFYHKVFYHLYKLAIKTGERTAPLNSVIPTITFLQCFNLMVFDTILDIVGVSFTSFSISQKNSNIYLLIVYSIIAALNYLHFTTEGRYKKLVKAYEKKPLAERKLGARLTLVYALVSIALIFILAPLRMKLM